MKQAKTELAKIPSYVCAGLGCFLCYRIKWGRCGSTVVGKVDKRSSFGELVKEMAGTCGFEEALL
jgi:hypothetical protein